MRRLVVASALGLALLAMGGVAGTASARPLGAQAPVVAAQAPDAGLLTPVHYRRPYGHQYHRPYYAGRGYYAPPRRHHWRPHHHYRHGWRR